MSRHISIKQVSKPISHTVWLDLTSFVCMLAAYEEREAYPYEPEPIQDYPSEEYEQVNRNGMDVERNDVQGALAQSSWYD